MRLYACNLFKCSRCFDSLNCLFWHDRFSVRFGFLGNATAVYRTVYEAISKAVTNVSVKFLANVYLGFVSLSAWGFSLL